MSFFSDLGFSGDPFQSTNAGDEPRLPEYFVPPPYFASVIGDVTNPKSQVILAPRGAGKTAQRVMVENQANKDDFLCIAYDDFPFATGFKLDDATLEYHLKNICTKILIGILIRVDEVGKESFLLNNADKEVLKAQIPLLLGRLSEAEFENAISSIKNLRDKASAIWNKYGGVIAAGINALIAKYGFGSIDNISVNQQEKKSDDWYKFHLKKQIDIAKKLGFKSVYVLIDRIDETSLTTTNSQESYKLIRHLMTDLPTLEERGIAFKFFLWDQVGESYSKESRPDRIKVFKLNWQSAELGRMLSERLKAFSNRKYSSFNDLTDAMDLDVHKLVAHLGMGSPRDMIRICGRIVDEHTRSGQEVGIGKIGLQSVVSGIKAFCDERSQELFGQFTDQIKRVKAITFTVNQLANDVLRVSQQAARNRIGPWQKAGAIRKVDEIVNKGNRPLHLYGIVDPRLAIEILSVTDFEMVLKESLFVCKACRRIVPSDQKTIVCECGERTPKNSATSLWKDCELII